MKICKKKILEKSVTYLLLISQIKMHFEEIYSVSRKCMFEVLKAEANTGQKKFCHQVKS